LKIIVKGKNNKFSIYKYRGLLQLCWQSQIFKLPGGGI